MSWGKTPRQKPRDGVGQGRVATALSWDMNMLQHVGALRCAPWWDDCALAGKIDMAHALCCQNAMSH